MDKIDEYCKVFEEKIKNFNEFYDNFENFARMETSITKKHKLTMEEENFLLPKEVLQELKELEMADLIDFEKELWKI